MRATGTRSRARSLTSKAPFRPSSGAYTGIGTAISVATSVLAYFGIFHAAPSLDNKVDKLLNEVAQLQTDTRAIIGTLKYTNAALDQLMLNQTSDFVVTQEGNAYGDLAGLHQYYLMGSPPSPATAVQLNSSTASAVYDLENGTVWNSNPLPTGAPGPFEWRYAMLPYLYTLSARLNVLAPFNAPQDIAPGWGSELHDHAAFILNRVALTRKWTTDRCQVPAPAAGGLGLSETALSVACAVDQWQCVGYDYYGNCTDWYWDPYCGDFITTPATKTKKCDFAATTANTGPGFPETTFSAGDDVETRSLHALGIDNWMHTAAAVHALAAGASYAGCHTDAPARALPSLLIGSLATIKSCVTAAKAANLNYAGLQYGGECWGGNSVGLVQVPDMNCSMPCDADGGAMCGGSWANSIYQVISSADELAATSIGVAYSGCRPAGTLTALLLSTGASVASCTALGRSLGYPYVGLATGGACYGGWSPGAQRVSESSCSQACTADSSEVCGGTNVLNVFEVQDEPCPYGSGPQGVCL